MTLIELYRSVEIRNSGLLMYFNVTNVKFYNSGIGSYECHGYKGFDAGVDYVGDFEIEDVRVFSDRRNKLCSISHRLKDEIERKLLNDTTIFEELDKILDGRREY